MRKMPPDNISKLADIFAPYLVLDREKKEYVLKDNAPAVAIQAKRAFHEWYEKHMRK